MQAVSMSTQLSRASTKGEVPGVRKCAQKGSSVRNWISYPQKSGIETLCAGWPALHYRVNSITIITVGWQRPTSSSENKTYATRPTTQQQYNGHSFPYLYSHESSSACTANTAPPNRNAQITNFIIFAQVSSSSVSPKIFLTNGLDFARRPIGLIGCNSTDGKTFIRTGIQGSTVLLVAGFCGTGSWLFFPFVRIASDNVDKLTQLRRPRTP